MTYKIQIKENHEEQVSNIYIQIYLTINSLFPILQVMTIPYSKYIKL